MELCDDIMEQCHCGGRCSSGPHYGTVQHFVQLQNQIKEYPGEFEELDPHFPKPLGNSLTSRIYIDANHVHNEVNRRFIPEILPFVGSTPASWISKRQRAIGMSTYSAEMCAMKVAREEAIALHYML
jgi:hypothetical protein